MSAVEQIYSADIVEIVLDLPMPPSTNRLWRSARGRVFKAPGYVKWLLACDAHVMATRQFPRRKIQGPFSFDLQVERQSRGDLDNKIKASMDWLVSRDVVRDDADCQRLSAEWVSNLSGVRVTLRSLDRDQVMGAGR